jgi:hypothetical protein
MTLHFSERYPTLLEARRGGYVDPLLKSCIRALLPPSPSSKPRSPLSMTGGSGRVSRCSRRLKHPIRLAAKVQPIMVSSKVAIEPGQHYPEAPLSTKISSAGSNPPARCQ